MIGWALSHLEKNPYRAFYQKELEDIFPEEFARAVQEKLLARIPVEIREGVVGHYDYGLSRPYVVYCENGFLEAFDSADPEAEPLVLTRSHLVRWEVNLPQLARRFQEANGLTGTPECIDARLWFLGEMEVDEGPVACLLAFLNGTSSVEALLRALSTHIPKKYRRFAVAYPSYVPPLKTVRQLETAGAVFLRLDPEDPFHFPDVGTLDWRPARSDNAEDFQHSDDYHWVNWNGQEIGFTPRQAEIVRLLHQAWRSGTPEVAWDRLRVRLGLQGLRLRDLFKGSPAWGTLVIRGRARGLYRLNL